MFLRWIVNSYLRQTAQRSLYQAFGEVLQGRSPLGEDPAEAGPPPPCAAALVFGSDLEAGGFVDALGKTRVTRGASFTEFDGRRGERRLVVVETGTGLAAAQRGVDDAITLLEPQWVISAGFAGALDERLKKGHFLMADTVADETGDELATGLKLDPATVAATPGLHVGKLLTIDRLVREESERRELAARHRAVACDMETMAVARVCRERRVRFLAVRVISETVDHALSREMGRLVEQNSLAGKLGVVAATLLQRPGAVKDLWAMREDAIKLSDRLAKFLGGVVDQLT